MLPQGIVLSPDDANKATEVTDNILFTNLCKKGGHLKDYLVSAKASQDGDDVPYFLQTERTWTRATGDILSVYHTPLRLGSHIFRKSRL